MWEGSLLSGEDDPFDLRTASGGSDVFQKIFVAAPIGIAYVAPDYKIVKVNPALCAMLGYSEEELTAMSFIEITHPEDLDKDVELAQRLFEREISHYQLEKRYLAKNGDVIWINLTATVISNEGKIYGLGLIEDITERKRIEQERERLVRQLLQALAQLKILHGLLPICAACKKIRNDQGQWTQIESYITAHSEAIFSHSICPDCMGEYLP